MRTVIKDDLIIALDITSDYWVVDSKASCHSTHHRKFFHGYVLGDCGHVLLCDDESCKIVGMGKVRIKLNNGNEWLLKYVRCIPSLRRNMSSIGNLGDTDCLPMFGETWWKITKGSLVIEKKDRVGALYYVLIILILIYL